MANIRMLILSVALMLGLTACANKPDQDSCRVVEIANDEGDFAPAWYISAGDVLERCGIKGAKEDSERKACAAQKRNGYAC